MLLVKKLHPNAKLPVVTHVNEDLGYDLFSLEDVVLPALTPVKVRTGIAARSSKNSNWEKEGLLIRDRSSMAAKGIMVSGGVIDCGYNSEIAVIMTLITPYKFENASEKPFTNFKDLAGYWYSSTPGISVTVGQYSIKAGDKIAQMIPVPVSTGHVVEVDELPMSLRGERGFGSSGR